MTVAQRRDTLQRQVRDLLALKDANDLEIARIKKQLEDARFSARTTGTYSDSDWYSRAQYALRMRGRDSQRFQQKIGDMNRALRQLNNAQVELCFVEAARRRLSGAEFLELWEHAKQLSAERAGEVTDDATT